MDASVTPRPAPTRARPFEKTQGRTPLWLRLWLGRDLAPSREEFQAALDGLWVGDPAMDELVAWMEEYGRGRGHKLFQQALKQGVDSLTDAPEPLVRFFRRVENRPDWVDPELLELGARFIHGTGEGATFVLRDLALMGAICCPGSISRWCLPGRLPKVPDVGWHVPVTGGSIAPRSAVWSRWPQAIAPPCRYAWCMLWCVGIWTGVRTGIMSAGDCR